MGTHNSTARSSHRLRRRNHFTISNTLHHPLRQLSSNINITPSTTAKFIPLPPS